MSGSPPGLEIERVRQRIEAAWCNAGRARTAAARADLAAARDEQLAAAGGRSAEMHARMARAHRQSAARERAAATMQSLFASALARWVADQQTQVRSGGLARPVLMGAVAATAGWGGAVCSLRSESGLETLVAASDGTARRAHELEIALAEGPSWRAIAGRAVAARGPDVCGMWPSYGAAIAELGIDAVAAVPLRLDSVELRGSVTFTDPGAPGFTPNVARLLESAEALCSLVLSAPNAMRPTESKWPGLDQLEYGDFQPTLHQAAGVLWERNGWRVEDAIALIRARAYAEDRSVADVSADVLRGEGLVP